jgi:hypothetical protein
MKRQMVPDVRGWEMVEGNGAVNAKNAKTAAPQQLVAGIENMLTKLRMSALCQPISISTSIPTSISNSYSK